MITLGGHIFFVYGSAGGGIFLPQSVFYSFSTKSYSIFSYLILNFALVKEQRIHSSEKTSLIYNENLNKWET